jgi:hypothetical protein
MGCRCRNVQDDAGVLVHVTALTVARRGRHLFAVCSAFFMFVVP